MKKNYFILFGSRTDEGKTSELIAEKLDIEFEPHDSIYVGPYLRYSGLYADKLTIERNRQPDEDDFKEDAFRDFPTLIYVSLTSGKNPDKLSKLSYLKAQLQRIDKVELLRESIVEEK